MRPASILHFERILFAALSIDLINNLLSWNLMAARIAAEGMAPNPLALLAMSLASPLVGLLFWYFVARRRSNIARWVMTAVVAVGAAAFAYKAAKIGATMDRLLVLGLVSELLKAVAVFRLFTGDANRWYRTAPATA